MATTLSTIRSLIHDLAIVVEEELILDGVQKAARLKYTPVIGSSVTFTPAVTPSPTVTEQSGLLTFATAPASNTHIVRYNTILLLDATIQDIIDLHTEDGSISADGTKLAAANCLDAIASNQALILKQIALLDFKSDGPALAKTLREHAKALREQVGNQDFDERTFEIVEQINDTFGYREKILKDFIREEG